ncbi:MAG: hypothetical protein AAF735_01310 [Myxococcota bacterium]
MRFSVLAGLGAASLGCGGEETTPSPRTTVEFVYEAPTSRDRAVAEAFPTCVSAVGRTHIHPSWRGFSIVPFENEGDRWRIIFDDVPAGPLLRVRVSDGNSCDIDLCGATTENLFANSVELTERASTPGGCTQGQTTEPGLSFTVDTDGTVIP